MSQGRASTELCEVARLAGFDISIFVLRTTATATHDGDFEGIPRTGRAVTFTGLVVYRIVGDKIAESWGEIDFLRLIRELRKP